MGNSTDPAVPAMPDEKSPAPVKDKRQQRLEEALKANLKRRKEQARARQSAPSTPETSPPSRDDQR
ncbi:hypothetical protein [Consotaella salsifontis]|uniref:hypothetical protein n=1 Tax=Consotaella salsifontis TaxID=1365950 RepID=UPI00105590F4|nr:hypothetical protein [Consotaella salsifontis]